jgi:hypothetical protein
VNDKAGVDFYFAALHQLALVECRPGWLSNYYLYVNWDVEHRAWWIRHIEREAKKGTLKMATTLVEETVRQRMLR